MKYICEDFNYGVIGNTPPKMYWPDGKGQPHNWGIDIMYNDKHYMFIESYTFENMVYWKYYSTNEDKYVLFSNAELCEFKRYTISKFNIYKFIE